MQLRLLGPVEVVDATGRAIPVGGPKERALLALLGIHANEVVSEDRLIDALWGDEPPRTASKTIQAYISRLRRALASAGADDDSLSIETRPPGYRLMVAPGSLDVVEVEELVAQAQAAAVTGDHGWAAVALSRAWRLWRGRSLGEFADLPFASATAIRLEDLRQVALEERIEAELASGRHAPLVGELEALCAAHPLRERLWAQRMVALYRSGRQAEALRVFQDLRHHLGEELGIEPGPSVTAVEQAVIGHDPALDWSPAVTVSHAPATGSELPSGVVTFLLTDIVESTALWDAHGAAMPAVLERHDRIVNDTVAAGGGHTIKSKGEGDSTLSVFGRATDAASTALDLHAALTAEPWPPGIAIRVRIALHTGEANERGGDYYGATVNRAARLRSLASGDQIVLSAVTAGLVRDHLPSGWILVDRGRHELRGLAREEQVFELSQGHAPTADAPATGDPASLALPLPVGLRTGPTVAFVGRTDELERLTVQLESAMLGVRQAVLLAGEPGIGKTRLAAEIARAAHGHAAVVLFGRCDEDLAVPYQPFAEALAQFVAHSPDMSTDLLGTPPGELVHLMPQLNQHVVGLPPPFAADAETERQRLFDAVTAWLSTVAARAPVVLVLDDLHWATKATLLLLRHVLRATSSDALYIVGTYRDTELGRTHPLANVLADLRREANVERVLLKGLDTDAVTSFVEAAARRPLEPVERELAEAMRVETNGNPFFMGEVMRHLVEMGTLRRSEGQWVLTLRSVEQAGLPEGVREVISRRVSRLSDATNAALSVASVVGPTFERQLLEQIPDAGTDPDSLLDALDEAVRAGILVESGRGYSFSHALIRQTLYGELTSARRTRLHRRVGEAIEALPDAEARIEALAHHFAESALDGQEAKAVDYCRRAGEQALARLAYEEAAELFGRAVQASDMNAPVLREDERTELLDARCEALLAGGDVTSASGAIADLQSSAKGSARLAAWAACFAGQLAVLTHPEQLDDIERAVATAAEQLAGLDDAAGEAKAHTVRAACLARLGRIADCETALDRALTAARRGGEHRRVNAVLAGEPLAALWGPNPVPRAGGRCLDVIRLLRITTGSPAVEATSMRSQAVLEAFRGRPDAARHMIDLARRALADLGLRHAVYEVDLFAGIVELVTDAPADAEPYLRRAYSGFRSMGVDVDAAQAAAHLARACIAIGRDEEAEELCVESERLGGHDLQSSIAWRAVRAQLLARAGDHAAARELADSAVAIAERTDALVDHGDACLALGTVLLAAGDDAGARAAADRAAALYERKGAAALVARARALIGGGRQRALEATPQGSVRDAVTLNAAARIWADVAARIPLKDIASAPLSPQIHYESHRQRREEHGDDSDYVVSAIEVFGDLGLSHVTPRLLATRGERLLLTAFEAHLDGFELTTVAVCGVNEEGLPDLLLLFDVEDLDAAYAELDARYLTDEGAEHAATLTVLAAALDAFNKRDELADAIHDHVELVDHRFTPSRSASGRAEMLPIMWGELADMPDLTMRATALHVVDDVGGVATVVQHGHAPDGTQVEQTFHVAVVVNDGRVVRLEGYPEHELDAALARFAELDATVAAQSSTIVGPRPNTCSRVVERVTRLYPSDDAAELLASDYVWDDRRTGIRTETLGTDDIEETLHVLRGVGAKVIEGALLATAGERLALRRTVAHSGDASGFRTDLLFVHEIDADGLLSRSISFDIDDMNGAQREMYERWVASGEVEHPEVLRAAMELSWLLNDRDWYGFERVLAGAAFETHRHVAGLESGISYYIESLRQFVDLVPDLNFVSAEALAMAAHGVVGLGLSSGTTVDGAAVELALLSVILVDGGRVTSIELYDAEDRAAALARFEELRPASPAGPKPNACSALVDRLVAEWIAGQPGTDALDPDYSWVDRRSGLHDVVQGRSGMADMAMAIRDVGTHIVDAELLATVGDRLALHRATFRGRNPDGFRSELLMVSECTSDGLYESTVSFDADDINGAVRELYERWIASGEVEHEDIARMVLDVVVALNDRRWGYVEDMIGRAPVGGHQHLYTRDFDPGEILRALQSFADLMPDAMVWPSEAVAIGSHGALVMWLVRGTSLEGAEVEFATLNLAVVESGRMTMMESFAPEARDAALARFEELRPRQTVGPRPNAAHAALVSSGRPADDAQLVATFGDRIAIERLKYRSEDPERIHTDVLSVVQVDEAGLTTAHVTFEPDDISGVIREATTRWVASGEVENDDVAWTGLAILEAINNRDWDRLAEVVHDPEPVSHRRVTLGFGPSGYVSQLRSLAELAPDLVVWPAEMLAVGPHGALHRVILRGTSDDVNEFELVVLHLMVIERGRATRVETFEPEDRDAALARFEELRPATFDTSATRTLDKVLRACRYASWDDLATCIGPGFRCELRRRNAVAKRVTGRDGFVMGLRSAEETGFTRVYAPVIAVRGDDLALAKVSVVTDDHESSPRLEYLSVVGVDADRRYAVEVQFDVEDIEAAYAELDARYRAGGGVPDVAPRDNACVHTIATWRDRLRVDLSVPVDLFADDIEWIDRRPHAQTEVRGLDVFAEAMAAIVAVGGNRVEFDVWAALGDRMAFVLIKILTDHVSDFRADVLGVVAVNEAGEVWRAATFELEQLDDALRELFDRWVELEA